MACINADAVPGEQEIQADIALAPAVEDHVPVLQLLHDEPLNQEPAGQEAVQAEAP